MTNFVGDKLTQQQRKAGKLQYFLFFLIFVPVMLKMFIFINDG